MDSLDVLLRRKAEELDKKCVVTTETKRTCIEIYELVLALSMLELVMNRFCVACLVEARAEVEALGLGRIDAARRRLEQARERVAACPATARIAKMIDRALDALNGGEYRKTLELIDRAVDALLSVELEKLARCIS
jgi:hypothetical protein